MTVEVFWYAAKIQGKAKFVDLQKVREPKEHGTENRNRELT